MRLQFIEYCCFFFSSLSPFMPYALYSCIIVAMTIAEIHGKISETGVNLSERMEDLLTSDIFGCMRYVPPAKLLMPFLSTACSFHGFPLHIPGRIIKTHYSFWPWLKVPGCIPCEPDVAIGLETTERTIHLLLIEAKYYSGLSSDEDERSEPNDQLARELDNLLAMSIETLHWGRGLKTTSRNLLFITQHMGIPRDLLRQSLTEYEDKRCKVGDIFWTSWRFLPQIIDSALARETNPEHASVMRDMSKLLIRKGLIFFTGVDPVTEPFKILDFYRVSPRHYLWRDIAAPLTIDYTFEVNRNG